MNYLLKINLFYIIIVYFNSLFRVINFVIELFIALTCCVNGEDFIGW